MPGHSPSVLPTAFSAHWLNDRTPLLLALLSFLEVPEAPGDERDWLDLRGREAYASLGKGSSKHQGREPRAAVRRGGEASFAVHSDP